MRKLATIRTITEILPHTNADNLSIAVVDGWKLVIKSGDFNVGDVVVYCEVDSFLPIKPEYEFLRKTSYKKMGDIEGFRLKTIRLRGEISQGLLLPVTVLPEGVEYKYGDDVTDVLGILKYEPPIPANLSGEVKGSFPSFIPKTDEERVQNLRDYNRLRDNLYYVTEKIDGASITIYYNQGTFGVCSRNLELTDTENNSYWKVVKSQSIQEKLTEYCVRENKNLAIQGELHGFGIQKNIYAKTNQDLVIFTVFDIDNQTSYGLEAFKEICENIGVNTVPILDESFQLPPTVDELIRYADGKTIMNPSAQREGVVIRTLDGKQSFKAISNEFLLKEK